MKAATNRTKRNAPAGALRSNRSSVFVVRFHHSIAKRTDRVRSNGENIDRVESIRSRGLVFSFVSSGERVERRANERARTSSVRRPRGVRVDSVVHCPRSLRSTMPATTRRRRARDDVHDDDVHSGSDESDAPEEVTGSSARAAATARRGAEREATRAKREETKAAAAVKRRKEAARVAEVVKKKRTKEEKAAADEADEEDDLEELPDDVVDALGRRERGERNGGGGETSESDDDDEDAGAFEAHVSGGKKRKKPKGKKAKRRAYERDGFEVVALDVDGEDDGAGGGVGTPTSAMDFMRSRLLEKHARSGEMLRNAKTGRIPNAFARR